MPWLMAILLVVWTAPAALAGASASPLGGPQPSIGLLPSGERALTCRDFKGRTVRLVEIVDLGDVGRAEIVNATPVIMIDPKRMGALPANLQVFFSLHECAHHVLGHLFAPTVESEKQADCWAIQQGRGNQAFTREDLATWKPFFAASRGSKMGHLPGPERVDFLVACFDAPAG
jgi:hypothetical protein